jgi:endonuclease-3
VLVTRLNKAYPGATCALTHENPLQLLVATILSAQCTDARVNKVTPALFARYPEAADYAGSDRAELEELVRTTGFFRNKAKSIHGATSKINSDFKGEVPRTMEEILTLPGVARKTGNVVLGTAFGIASGFVVDTHVFRLSHRMGLSDGKNPVQVEKQLTALIPEKDWIDFAHILIHHGRAVCVARAPRCEECVVESYCPKIGVEAKPAKVTKPKTGQPLSERIAASKTKKTKAK